MGAESRLKTLYVAPLILLVKKSGNPLTPPQSALSQSENISQQPFSSYSLKAASLARCVLIYSQ